MSSAEIEQAVEDGEIPEYGTVAPLKFLSKTEVAHYLGLAGLPSLTSVKLPPPDAMIGDHKGWTEATIDEWNATRPGRGRWGARDL